MKKIFVTVCLSVFCFVWVWGQNPLWLRHSAISPDGKFIAFTYKGDIYKVPTQGGEAERLTTNPAYETQPVWSPDSQQIAFVSSRDNGYLHLYLMSAQGGEAQQLTFHTAGVLPLSFFPDGKSILFLSNQQPLPTSGLFPKFQQLYKISVKGGQPECFFTTPLKNLSFSPDGKIMYYEDYKGVENEWRKHHTSSVTRDIWSYDFNTKKYKKLIGWQGEDRNPVARGESLYYLSEKSGSFNVFVAKIKTPEQAQQLTFFKDFPVRSLSASQNQTLCFSYGGELYTLAQGEKSPKKVPVSIRNDVDTEQKQLVNFTQGATSVAVSPNGKEIAMVVRGEVFVTATDYTTTKQISQTAAAEQGVSFSADGKTLVYASYRDGYWDLYKATPERPQEPNFSSATLIKEEKLISGDHSEKMHPKFSPDGKEIAFVQNRTHVAVYNLETQKIRRITDPKYQVERNGDIHFEWSPDSQWFVVQYVARQHAPYYDVGIISAKGGEPVFNVTDSGYFDTNPHWVLDGNAITWSTEKYGMRNHASWGSMRDQMLVFLNRKSFDLYKMNKEEFELYSEANKPNKEKAKNQQDKAPEPIQIEWENMQERMVRLTPNSSNLGDAIISKDGKKLYYLSSFEGGYDLWAHDLREKSTKLLSKLNGSSLALMMDKDGKKIFLLGSKKMQLMELPSEKIKSITYSASMMLDAVKEREFMFDMVRREEQQRFYLKNMHGVNWQALTQRYERFLPYINNNYDFSQMLSEMLGELNVSHTGSGYRAWANSALATARLGAFVLPTSKGLEIQEIVTGGGFDNFESKAQKGDIIQQIDGQKVTLSQDFNQLLQGKVGKKILLELHNPKTGETWQEIIKGISTSAWNEMLYKRWVKQRADEVEKYSKGRLGYVHIRSMNDESFRKAYSEALGKYNQKEGLVIDIRYNGGGRLHEDLEVFFSGKKYLTQMIQGEKFADMPSRRWNKPSVMLINEADYSNAHGSPWVYKHMKIGKLVGQPVPGTMTSVNWVTLQDPSLYFGIPVIGYQTAQGTYLENSQLEPDILAELDYGKLQNGEDTQLRKAVDELLKQL